MPNSDSDSGCQSTRSPLSASVIFTFMVFFSFALVDGNQTDVALARSDDARCEGSANVRNLEPSKPAPMKVIR